MAKRENENNAYAKFWGEKQRALWYVMVFSGLVNCIHSYFFLIFYDFTHENSSLAVTGSQFPHRNFQGVFVTPKTE